MPCAGRWRTCTASERFSCRRSLSWCARLCILAAVIQRLSGSCRAASPPCSRRACSPCRRATPVAATSHHDYRWPHTRLVCGTRAGHKPCMNDHASCAAIAAFMPLHHSSGGALPLSCPHHTAATAPARRVAAAATATCLRLSAHNSGCIKKYGSILRA